MWNTTIGRSISHIIIFLLKKYNPRQAYKSWFQMELLWQTARITLGLSAFEYSNSRNIGQNLVIISEQCDHVAIQKENKRRREKKVIWQCNLKIHSVLPCD